MTERLYQHDSYLHSFDSTVREVQGDAVVLEATAFFPTGGGVLGDEGTLAGPAGETWRVVETTEAEGQVLHHLDRPGLSVGDAVHGELDWPRRYRLMRYHTATHVLCGVMFHEHGVKVTGNQLTPERGRVDFSFPAFDRAVLEEGFRRSNELIGQDLPVIIDWISATEAQARPELFKLETGFRHDFETLRLVAIGDFDVQADGGCHVAALHEVGPLQMGKSENKGKANRRVYFTLAD